MEIDRNERGYIMLTHFLNIIPLWGILVSGIIWMTFKEKSRRIVFHAQQAIFFQVIFLCVILVGLVAKLFISLIGVLNTFFSSLLNYANNVILILIFAAYILTCLYAAFKVHGGDEFLYPFAGKRLMEATAEDFDADSSDRDV